MAISCFRLVKFPITSEVAAFIACKIRSPYDAVLVAHDCLMLIFV